MKHISILLALASSCLHGQDIEPVKNRVLSLFLHIDYAYQSYQNIQKAGSEALIKKEQNYYKIHLKEAMKLQKQLLKNFPLEDLSSPSDRDFVLQSLKVWGEVAQRNLDKPNIRRMKADHLNIEPQRNRFISLFEEITGRKQALASIKPAWNTDSYQLRGAYDRESPQRDKTEAAIKAADNFSLGLINWKLYSKASFDETLNPSARRRAKAKFKAAASSLNSSAKNLADIFPVPLADANSRPILRLYWDKRAFPDKIIKPDLVEKRLSEAAYIRQVLEQEYNAAAPPL